MICGVKIDVPYLNGNEWLESNLLDFYTATNVQTGEIKEHKLIAKYNGLTFIITASRKHDNIRHCQVQGSLHKYFNNGEHNANDFTFADLQTILEDLKNKFQVIPEKAILRNLEFGVNIKAPITVKELLKNIVAYGNSSFASLKIQGIKVGKWIEKQQYKIKVYDKGKQYKRKTKNLVRIEISVNKMRFLESYGIINLSSLKNHSTVFNLGVLLHNFWNNTIYYDQKLKWKLLNEFERKKVLYYAAERNWEEFDRKQRYRAKKHLDEITKKYGTGNSKTEIDILITKKWKELAADKCPRFNRVKKDHSSRSMSTNYPLEHTVKMSHSEVTSQQKKNSRDCIVCGKDISNKRKDAVYCSKSCNNSFHAKKRKQKRKLKRDFLKVPIRLNLVTQIKSQDKIRKRNGLKPIASIRGLSRILGSQYPERYNPVSFHGTLANAEKRGFKQLDKQLISDLAEVLGSNEKDLLRYPIHRKNWKQLLSCN